MKPALYLAGPVYGCTEAEAKDWRADVAAALPWVNCISPLRCEPMAGKRYDLHYEDLRFGHPKSILAKNFLDVQRCDMVLAHFPAPPEIAELDDVVYTLQVHGLKVNAETLERIAKKGVQRSIGTIGEISWAFALRKPCIVVSDDPLILHHPFTSMQPDWPVLPDLDHAIELITGIWWDYCK